MILDLDGKFVDVSVENGKASQTKNSCQTSNLKKLWKLYWRLVTKQQSLRKFAKFFEGTNETAEQYIKSSLKMLMKA